MVAAIPSDSGFVAPTIGTPGFEAFDNAQASDFVVPQIDQPDFPTDFVAPPFDPAAGGFQTEAGGPGLTQDAANDPNFVAPTVADDPMAGLAAFAADNPTGGEVVEPSTVVDTPVETAAPSTFDALETQLDADQTSGGSVAEAAVPDAGTPADAATEVVEEVTTDAPPATTDEPIAG